MKYIIYTPEGSCEDPKGNEVWNCQVLGFSEGDSHREAIQNLISTNEWIVEDGFDPSEMMARRLHDSESC